MLETVKGWLQAVDGFREAWGAFRRWQLHRDYETRREHYARLAQEAGVVYREAEVIAGIRERLAKRGYTPRKCQGGGIHTFAFVPDLGWHRHLLPDLRELGPVTLFDYVPLGFRVEHFQRGDRNGLTCRQVMNDMMLAALREAHARRSVDWIFVYASGVEISAGTIRRMIEELGIPTVNMCLDDKHSWTGSWMGDHHAGQRDIAPVFDVSWTSARVACEWYLMEGARPIYMPEGFDLSTYRPLPVIQDIPVSFIGGAYGYRPSVVRYLEKHGVHIQCFGRGWGTHFISADEQVNVINRSQVNLGMGGIAYSESLTSVKARDFEVPGTGGGVYLTSFNPDLAQHFVIGEEILCYRSRDEMLELIRHYLARPEVARAVAKRGRERCVREHRWLHRYERLVQILGILGDDGRNKESVANDKRDMYAAR